MNRRTFPIESESERADRMARIHQENQAAWEAKEAEIRKRDAGEPYDPDLIVPRQPRRAKLSA